MASIDVRRICSEGEHLGLHVINCEIVCRPDFLPSFPSSKDFHLVDQEDAALLVAPRSEDKVLDGTLDHWCSVSLDRLQLIKAHDALELLKACLNAPMVHHLLRCSPCLDHHAHPSLYSLLSSGTGLITKCTLTDAQWLQAAAAASQ